LRKVCSLDSSNCGEKGTGSYPLLMDMNEIKRIRPEILCLLRIKGRERNNRINL